MGGKEEKMMKTQILGKPLDQKSYELNPDGTLTITGIISTNNKDLVGDIVSIDTLHDIVRQAPAVNLYLDHNRDYTGGIGSVDTAWLDEDNQAWITATILSEYAPGILERLKIGMNFGFSISGFPQKTKTNNANLITAYDLKDISLTYIPANWDTYGTVESKNLVTSNCLTGACYHILNKSMNNGEIMSNNQSTEETGLNETQKNETVNLINEMKSNIIKEVVENLTPELEKICKTICEEYIKETPDEPVNEPGEEEVDEKADNEIDEGDEGEQGNESSEGEPVKEPEDKNNPPQDNEEEDNHQEEETPEETPKDKNNTEETEEEEEEEDEPIDEKTFNKIIDTILTRMNEKNSNSKFQQFTENQEHKKSSPTFLGGEKRDEMGRNKRFL